MLQQLLKLNQDITPVLKLEFPVKIYKYSPRSIFQPLQATCYALIHKNKNAYQHCVAPHLLSKVETNYLKSELYGVNNWNIFLNQLSIVQC